MSHCPNCGAPIASALCEYCGTRHWDIEQKFNDEIIKAKAQLRRDVTDINRLYQEAIQAMRRYNK